MTQSENRVTGPIRSAATLIDPRILYFDEQAPHWDATGPNPARTLERLQALRPRLPLRPGQTVLEVGCGTGQVTGWLCDQVQPGQVVAIDFSPAMLAQARQRGVNADFHCLDICQEQAVPRRFDVIFCFHAFPHFRDKPAALRQMQRQLKADGRLLILHLMGSAQLNALHGSLSEPIRQDHLPAPIDWTSLLPPAGLRLITITDDNDLFYLESGLDSTSPRDASTESSGATERHAIGS